MYKRQLSQAARTIDALRAKVETEGPAVAAAADSTPQDSVPQDATPQDSPDTSDSVTDAPTDDA